MLCTLNNTRLRVYRNSQAYQAVLIDLAVNGIIDKDKTEKLLGYEIPKFIRPVIAEDNDTETKTETETITASRRTKTED